MAGGVPGVTQKPSGAQIMNLHVWGVSLPRVAGCNFLIRKGIGMPKTTKREPVSRVIAKGVKHQFVEDGKYIQSQLNDQYEEGVRRFIAVGLRLNSVREALNDQALFEEWVSLHLRSPHDGRPLSVRSARRYVLLAKRTNRPLSKKYKEPYVNPQGKRTMTEIFAPTHPSLGREKTKRPVPDWEIPIRKELKTVGRLPRTNEAKHIQHLKRKIVSIGYKALATELHPDKPTGDQKMFGYLTKAKRQLTASINAPTDGLSASLV
ncbi:hypothetical protein [uncultured Mediterranean phage uvDeep-CGR2-AD3-C76]|nr:hypothetical protein [uncultured Mediterranean phage uvDeep-CGR2-AD3-C76]